MEPSNYGKEILRKNRIFKFKNANFSNTCIILWLKFSATLHLVGGGEVLPSFIVIYFFWQNDFILRGKGVTLLLERKNLSSL